jgi:hypothetical protein
MIRRLLYHFFWNFYDYLGSYALYGFVFTIAVLALAGGGFFVAGHIGSPVIGIAVLVITAAIILVMKAAALGGFYACAVRAAKDEPARWKHFREGMRGSLKQYLKLLLLLAGAFLLVAANVVFYSRFHGPKSAGGPGMIFLILSMVFFWVGVALWLFMHPALVAPGWYADEPRLRPVLRKAFIVFVLAPGFWIAVAISFLILLALCIVSAVGALFILPIFATLTATAYEIVARHAEYLAEARQELGDSRTVREYKKRAIEKAWEWEYKQPRRTFRELIKPWEM